MEEFTPVDVFQYDGETGVISQVEMVGVNSDPVIQMLVKQAEVDYIMLWILVCFFFLYLVRWGATLWKR